MPYTVIIYKQKINYRSVPGKRPLPGKHPCSSFQGVNVTASIQTYGNYIPGKRPGMSVNVVQYLCMYDTTVCISTSLLHYVQTLLVMQYIYIQHCEGSGLVSKIAYMEHVAQLMIFMFNFASLSVIL